VIAALAFGSPRGESGRAVRDIAFAPRSTLPVSAACLVANGVRELLSRLLAAEFEVELAEPAILGTRERHVVLDDATIVRVRGRLCDGFVIVRPADGRKLVALAFGEDERSQHSSLSEIERSTLDRIVAALLPLCNTLCGTLGPQTRETSERAAADLATYFEVRTTGAAGVAIGFGLSRDPAEEVSGQLTLDDLADIEIEGVVEFGRGALGVPAFSRLAPGVTLVLDTPLGAAGTLRLGNVPIVRGQCGLNNGRRAISFEAEARRSAA
jgi:flagellar motor switch/type III secretory pathway protein FliN